MDLSSPIDTDLDNYFIVRSGCLNPTTGFGPTKESYTERELNDHTANMRTIRSFLSITDGGIFEVSPSLNGRVAHALVDIRYALDHTTIANMFYKGVIVRRINMENHTYERFGSDVTSATFNSIVAIMFYDSPTPSAKIHRLIMSGVSGGIEVGATRIGNNQEDDIVNYVSYNMYLEFKGMVFRISSPSLRECDALSMVFGRNTNANALEMSAVEYDLKAKEKCVTVADKCWYKFVNKLAGLKADCLRIISGEPPRTKTGVNLMNRFVDHYYNDLRRGQNKKGQMWTDAIKKSRSLITQ